jgi:hypothetical protein
MNRFLPSAALGLAALLALAGRGYAQDEAADGQSAPGQDAPQRYEVEVILFADAGANPNEELFSVEQPAQAPGTTPLPLQPLPYGTAGAELQSVPGGGTAAANAVQPLNGERGAAPPTLQTGGTTPSADALQTVPVPPASGDAAAADGAAAGTASVPAFAFRLLGPDQMKLNAEYAKIRGSSAYRPLGHAAWIQEGLPEDRARPIDLAELGIANPSGTIQLHVSRYLHVSVNLTYRRSSGGTNVPAADEAAPERPAGAQSGAEADGLDTVTVAPRYIMDQQRRIRSGELQYFDHPMFGLLLLVTPAPQKPPEPPADGGGLTPAA